MSTVSKPQLLEYLEHAIEVERDLVGQESIIEKYTATCEYQKPKYVLKSDPVEPMMAQVPMYNNSNEIVSGIITLCIAIVFFILWIKVMITMPTGAVLSFIFLPCAIIFGVFAKKCFSKINNREKEIESISMRNREAKEKYHRQCEEVRHENENAVKRVNADLPLWQRSKDEGIAYLTERKLQTQTILEKYYSPDIIFPKYRNLPALTSIYEYLTSGRCEELTGPNGAYNLYEMELRQNIVISQLNTIISNLEQIRQNQYVLYQELVKVTAATQTISNEISAIRGYTYTLTELSALNAYYSAVTADCLSALTFLEVIG